MNRALKLKPQLGLESDAVVAAPRSAMGLTLQQTEPHESRALRPSEPFVAPEPSRHLLVDSRMGQLSGQHSGQHTGQIMCQHTGQIITQTMVGQTIEAQNMEHGLSEMTDPLPRVRIPSIRRDTNAETKVAGNPANIWFNWNGHSWCAFEVLGVPGSSSVAASQEAFRQAIANSASDSHPFLNEAIQAIERRCR